MVAGEQGGQRAEDKGQGIGGGEQGDRGLRNKG
jgi:hypothetical protein